MKILAFYESDYNNMSLNDTDFIQVLIVANIHLHQLNKKLVSLTCKLQFDTYIKIAKQKHKQKYMHIVSNPK